MKYALDRLGEPSTWASLAAIAAGVGYTIPPGVLQDCIFAAGAISAIVGIVTKEGWKKALESGDAVAALEARVSTLEASSSKKE
jgi:hypothetical protein